MAELEHTAGISVALYPSVSALNKAVARSEIDAGVVLPSGLAADERSGRPVSIGIAAERANTTQQAAVSRISSVIATYGGRVEAGQFASRFSGSYPDNLRIAVSLARKTPQVSLTTQVVAVAQNTLPAGFEYSAPTELVLFVFLTAVAGSSAVVESRRLGVFERVLAAPVRPSTIVIGESITAVSPAMRAVGHATPQAWAVDAWTKLLSGHGTIITIWHQLGILAVFALGFFAIATIRSRKLLRT